MNWTLHIGTKMRSFSGYVLSETMASGARIALKAALACNTANSPFDDGARLAVKITVQRQSRVSGAPQNLATRPDSREAMLRCGAP